jgi:hypothetical protein
VYLDTLEFATSDHGHDVAAAGAVFTMNRTNAGGALGAFWTGLRIQTLGSARGGKPIDAFASLAGLSRIGIDLSAAQFFAMDGTTPTNAAIAMAASARIYGSATNTGVGHFPNSTKLGTAWLSYEGSTGWNLVVGSTPVLQAASSGVAATQLRITTPSVPATATDACTKGQISYDPTYVYICVSTNTWRRAALAAW